MLTVKNVNTYYGQLQALKNVSLHLKKGEIVTLIGANGAGKSTLINTISGLTPPRTGTIVFDGINIAKLPPYQIVELGICQVPEGRQIFKALSVYENLELGAYLKLRRAGGRSAFRASVERVFALFPLLWERRDQPAGTLSGGEQQMLAIGRALMAQPKVLLLDEPSMGLAPLIVKEIFSVIQALAREGGTTVLLVEQNAKAALKIADRGYVLETGKVVMEGETAELMENREVKRAYLGRERKEIWER
ncbi:MAG TPA: ABC transporter ATP-binding protein [Syntrophales bacterium]|nr:ABC transporter ATP-binding protein [Syntrophales bacterium]HOL58366.1 ABC transporter ATP-binding protein [Syntrophales bacterium]HPO34535.1 ABC transporter ATP-binding protein [Syntrophales bacterium]